MTDQALGYNQLTRRLKMSLVDALHGEGAGGREGMRRPSSDRVLPREWGLPDGEGLGM